MKIFHKKEFFRTKIFFLLFLSIMATGCKKDKERQEEEAIKDPNTIRFWHFWSEPSQRKALEDLVEKFEKENDCRVQLTELSWNDGKIKLQAAFNSSTAPDVVELGSDWIPQFSSSGALAEIQDGTNLINNFVEYSKAPAQWQGKVFALPWSLDTRVLFINTELLQKVGAPTNPPATYKEMQFASEKIRTLGGETYGFAANGSDPHRLYKKILPMFWAYGGQIISSDGKLMINSAQNAKALEQYVALSRSGLIDTQRQLDAAFAQGNIGFWFSGSWLIDKIQKENPDLKYQVALMPAGDGGEGFSFAGGEYLAISQKSGKKELANKFVRFMTEGKNSLEFCKTVHEAGFPADKNYYNNEYFKSVKHRPIFAQQLEKAKMTPVHPRWLEIEPIIENAVVEAMYGQKTAQEALNGAQIEANSVIR